MGHFQYIVFSTFILCLFIKIGIPSPYLIADRGFCNETYTTHFDTKCQHCDINVFTDCPAGSVKQTSKEGVAGCEYMQNLGPGYAENRTGCYHTCLLDKQVVKCCPGYWGPQCQECPGGVANVCSGHGVCNDSVGGTGLCTCEDGYTGYACELCLNQSSPGQNCSLVSPPTSAACQNQTCPKNSKCLEIDGDAVCMCQWPYVDQEGTDNSTVNCSKVDFCQVPPLCHVNASCNTLHEPTVVKNCTCMPGYHGDGYVCDPVNPCQVDNGGCPDQSTRCVNDSPGKSHCECLPGYTEFVPGHGCHLIDVCVTNGSQCHAKATCETTAPFYMECLCPEGYSGNGKVCFGNILQTIQDLDAEDPVLKGQLSLIQKAMEKYYSTELITQRHFTVFVSTNSGFRTTNTANFQKWLDDGIRVREILRQHILIGEFPTEKLLNQSILYTLQGLPAELQAARGGVLKFRLHGNRKATILKKDVIASNGLIHVINRLMTYPQEVRADDKLPVTEVITRNGLFNRFNMLVKSAGPEIQGLLQRENITVFIASNGAFDSLPDNSLEYLQSDEGKEKLKVILKSHILDRRVCTKVTVGNHMIFYTYIQTEWVEVVEMVNVLALMAMSNIRIAVDVQENGAVMLNSKVRITQADIEASNGLLFAIDNVILPEGVSSLPNKCDNSTYKVVKGPCGDCSKEQVCYNEDVHTNETAICMYLQFSFGLVTRKQGCAALCNRTYITSECCSGFYGFDCLPCPGGYRNPCSGHGKCDERYLGQGACTCDENFDGVACEKCSRDNYFGPNCSQECTCIHGTCNSGPLGDGLCDMSVGCLGLFTGDNCHKHSMPCSSISSVQGFCHAHAQCIWNELRSDYSCICKPGYKGNGLECEEIDPCTEKLSGGCHLQATCKKTNPGQRNCTCNKGWSGDGLYCYPASSCSNHSDCDTNSQCIETTPGEHICKCNSGYHGDGKSCVLTDMCTVNNGNCHPKAACVAVGPGQVNCTCSVDLGYAGNGYSCYGNIIKQIQDHPDLTITANLLEQLDPDDIELFLDDDYTIFVPTDRTIMAFMRKTSALYWQKKDNSITLLNYHTLPNKTSIVQLVALSAVYKKFETMADGFSVHIFKEGKTVILSPREGSPVMAKVLEADIVATNGYLNVIDQVLEPYYPDPPDTYPDLETFFNSTAQCSIFGKWLKEKNLIKRLEDDLNEYTLFIPSDTYARTVNVTVTTDFLRYYFIPRMRLMASVFDGETAVTDLGIRHQLVYNVHGWDKVSVNNIPISTPDIFTLGGVVNIIDGLLHPVLHTCNETRKLVEFGICHECTTSYLCPEGYTVYKGAEEVQDCTFAVKSWFGNRAVKGCRGLCVIDKVIEGCCSGYYGLSCQECPGGPETPCHGGGHCSDGITGNGQCVCTGHFSGIDCDRCVHGWTGTKCDIDMYGCGYRNGGCHKAALCHRGDDGRISCKCASGYRGDGYNCTGPCEINNGGCHINANCLYKAAVGITCSCKAGFIGNGKDACNSDIYSTLLTLDGVSQFVKSVLLANDGNKTLDLLQTSGSDKLTVLVPVDSSLNNRILTASELQHQIALNNDTVTLGSIVPHTYHLRTLAGDAVIIRYDSQSSKFLANNTEVSQSDIICTNGVIHLVSSAFTKPSVRSQSPETAPPIVAIVIPIVVVVVLATIVIVAIVIYKKTQFGYWKLFHKWVPNKESGSDTTSEARLSFNDPDSPRSSSGSTGNTNFGNPLFQMNEDDL